MSRKILPENVMKTITKTRRYTTLAEGSIETSAERPLLPDFGGSLTV